MFRLAQWLLAAACVGLSLPAVAAPVTITFESFPGTDGVLGTADDVAPLDGIRPLSDEFSSMGLTFTQGSMWQSGFFDGNPDNHFISSTSPIGTFSVPVYSIGIDSFSYWDATLTAYGINGNVLATNSLLNPQAGSVPLFGHLAVSSQEAIYSFSILPNDQNNILNLDNMVLDISPVPEPSQYLLFALGLLVLGFYAKRRQA